MDVLSKQYLNGSCTHFFLSDLLPHNVINSSPLTLMAAAIFPILVDVWWGWYQGADMEAKARWPKISLANLGSNVERRPLYSCSAKTWYSMGGESLQAARIDDQQMLLDKAVDFVATHSSDIGKATRWWSDLMEEDNHPEKRHVPARQGRPNQQHSWWR